MASRGWVHIENWHTCEQDEADRGLKFQAQPGYVSPGATRPIETNFETLTERQKLIWRIENFHYMAVEFRRKLNDPVWMAVHGHEFRRLSEETKKEVTYPPTP